MKLYSFARGLAPYLTAYLLLVSLGLPLHKVYCACKGESEVSLLLSLEHECGHADLDSSFRPQSSKVTTKSNADAKASKSGCCSNKSSSSCSLDGESEHDCGDEETLIAKLSTSYVLDQEKSLLNGINFNALLPAQLGIHLSSGVATAKELPIRGPTPPPMPYGRELLLRYQSFLC